MKTGLILEGGGLRGAFTVGVLEVFAEENITFDYGIGASAGAATLGNFIAGQNIRSKEAVLCPRNNTYYGVREFFKSGKFMNLDKLYSRKYSAITPFDLENYVKNPMEREYVVTNCETGKAEYLTDDKTYEGYVAVSKATSSLPIISRPCKVGDKYYMDGSISDPIPMTRAQEKGCERIIFIGTGGKGMKPSDMSKFIWLMKIVYPSKFKPFIKAVKNRIPLLEKKKEYAKELEAQGMVMQIHPSGKVAIKHMERDVDKIQAFYEDGKSVAREKMPEIKKFLGTE